MVVGAWDGQQGGLPVALDRAVEGGWSRGIYTYSLTTLSEIQTMTYTDQGQVESDSHLVTSSPPPLPPRTASLDPQADSERQTCLTHTPTSLARCRYAEMHSRPQTVMSGCTPRAPQTAVFTNPHSEMEPPLEGDPHCHTQKYHILGPGRH